LPRLLLCFSSCSQGSSQLLLALLQLLCQGIKGRLLRPLVLHLAAAGRTASWLWRICSLQGLLLHVQLHPGPVNCVRLQLQLVPIEGLRQAQHPMKHCIAA
jgi:hypothetical protein